LCCIINGAIPNNMGAKPQKTGMSCDDLSRDPSTKPTIYKRYSSKRATGQIWASDALEFMRSLNSQSARIIFLDPPFNLGKVYGARGRAGDLLPETEYQRWMLKILDECIRALEDGGTLYLYHLPIWGMRFGAYLENKLDFRQWIAISMKNGFVRGERLYPAHYSLLMFAKGLPTVFNRPKTLPAECRHCGKYIKDYGGYKSIIEEKGINLSDIWDDISPVRHAQRKTRAANELPQIIFERVMQMSAQPGALYVDPFAGSGGGVLASTQAGMRFTVCDVVPSNCQLIAKRLDDLPRTKSREKRPVATKVNSMRTKLAGTLALAQPGA
jgi:site-specific DNA-methyltransferase (adenine-specific)